jgi:GT2 family glycosyltransferase
MSTGSEDTPAIPGQTAPDKPLTWVLCVATLDRIDMLETCVTCALNQTFPPSEVVICDASDAWQAHQARIEALASRAGIPLTYLPAKKRSSSAQRNQAIAATTADILFLIDDDAFMHPDCAETIMQVYESDRAGKIAAISATDGPVPGGAGLVGEAKSGPTKARLTERILSRSRIARFVWVELFLMSADRVFIPYDRKWHKADEATVRAYASDRVVPLTTIAGYRMTVRRSVALTEPFDGDLLAYASAEDLDATYRFSRHGWNVQALDAKLYHHEAMAARLKREQSTMLSVLKVAFLLRKNTNFPVRQTIQFYVMILRRLIAEFLKDLLSRRWKFRQVRCIGASIPDTLGILRHDRSSLGTYYDPIQRRVLGLTPVPLS